MKVLVAFTLIFFANSTFAQFSQETRDRGALNNLNRKLHEIAKFDLKCESEIDCVILPTGKRPCGGPSGYVLTSVNNQYLPYVEFLARQFTEKEHEYNVRYHVVSICSLFEIPTPVCDSTICKVQ